MSEEQINKILKRLDAQDIKLDSISERLKELEPVKDAFDNVMGFDRVSMWILKFMAATGTAVGLVYAFIRFIKQ